MQFNNFIFLTLMLCLFFSCIEKKKEVTTPTNRQTSSNKLKIHKVSPDEIHIDLALENITPDKTAQATEPEIKFIASQEMAALFDYLEMNIEQLTLFEVHYQYHTAKVKEENTRLLDQTEIQLIIDEIFKTILDPNQLITYKEWKEK